MGHNSHTLFNAYLVHDVFRLAEHAFFDDLQVFLFWVLFFELIVLFISIKLVIDVFTGEDIFFLIRYLSGSGIAGLLFEDWPILHTFSALEFFHMF
jgi:hypothetical protein